MAADLTDNEKSFIDLMSYGVSVMRDGKRVDPTDLYLNDEEAESYLDGLLREQERTQKGIYEGRAGSDDKEGARATETGSKVSRE